MSSRDKSLYLVFAVIAATFMLALMLSALPLPEWAVNWRPAWTAMVLIYWCMALPGRVGILTGWSLGLLIDVLSGGLLGQHALGLALIAFLTISTHRRVRVFPLLQQALIVGLMLACYQFLNLMIDYSVGAVSQGPGIGLSVISSMLLWPWLFIVLRDLRRKARLH